MSLLKRYLGKGHTVYPDKFEERLEKGEACFRTSNSSLVMKWIDKKEVYGGQQSVQQPAYVIDYNKSIGIIDKIDIVEMVLQIFLPPHRHLCVECILCLQVQSRRNHFHDKISVRINKTNNRNVSVQCSSTSKQTR